MDAKQYASAIIARLTDAPNAGDLQPFTLPEPTTEQVIDWLQLQEIPREIEYIRHDIEHRRHWRDGEQQEKEQKLADLERLRDDIETAYEMGELTLEQYARALTWPDPKERRRLVDSVATWRPMAAGNYPHPTEGTIAVFWMFAADGQRFDLTYEHGQWWRHVNGCIYSVFYKK